MPFGRKPGDSGVVVDFDAIYKEVIAPAIADAGLEPLRADEEVVGGIIHKPMFERLILCDFAVADLTTANANVFYELGVRHAIRPRSTVLLFAEGGRLPFDVAPLRALPYRLAPDGTAADAAAARDVLKQRLLAAKREAEQAADSPVFQLVENFPDIARLKTDVFRERADYARQLKSDLAAARKKGLDAVRAIEQSLGDLADVEAGVLIDLFLSYRAVKGWKEMIALAARLPKPIAATVMVQEQLALALNRDGQGEKAEEVIRAVLDTHGPSSESYGILGRIYKDRWDAAASTGETARARALLQKAIDAYLKGFETDWRDAYPGVNAVTLMELKDPPDARQQEILPVVTYAVKRRIAAGKPDYWDHATLLELAVLSRDDEAADAALGDALISVREPWEPETTLRNLRLIRDARERRGEPLPWLPRIMDELERAAK
jgi:MAP3K TRAFs-binding domain